MRQQHDTCHGKSFIAYTTSGNPSPFAPISSLPALTLATTTLAPSVVRG